MNSAGIEKGIDVASPPIRFARPKCIDLLVNHRVRERPPHKLESAIMRSDLLLNRIHRLSFYYREMADE